MTSATTYPAAEGERRKLSAFALLAARRAALIRRARRALLAVLIDRAEGTVDDVRAAVPVPDGIDPKAFGPVPGELAEAGIIAAVRYVKSTRPEAHARPVQVWRLPQGRIGVRRGTAADAPAGRGQIVPAIGGHFASLAEDAGVLLPEDILRKLLRTCASYLP